MMKYRALGWHFVWIGLLASLLFFELVQFEMGNKGADAMKVHALLEQGIRLDAESELNMLRLLNHHIYHYDELTASYLELKHWHQQLKQVFKDEPTIQPLFAGLDTSVGIQTDAIDEFKSDFGILANSVRYIPTMIDQLIQQYPQSAMLLSRLSRDIYQWELETDNAPLQQRIQQEQQALSSFVALNHHIDVLLQYHRRVRASIRKASTCGTPENISSISQAYDAIHLKRMEQQSTDEHRLQFVIAALLAYLLWLVVRLVHLGKKETQGQQALLLLKEELEEKVASLSDTEHRLQILLDVIPDAVVVHQNGRCLYANPAACTMYLGSVQSSLTGEMVMNYIHQDDQPVVLKRISNVQVGDELPVLLEKHLRADGSMFFAEVHAVCFENEHGKVILSLIRDVTQRLQEEEEKKALQEAMEHSQRLESLGVLAGGIAHDFNNLLAVILGNVEMLKMRIPKDERNERCVAHTLTAVQRAADLCRQMLAYSGKGHFVTEQVQLSSLVQGMVDLLQVSMHKGVQIHYQWDDGMAYVQADKSQIQQVVMNLITNANEAMEAGDIFCRTGVRHVNREALQSMYTADDVEEGRFAFVQVEDQGCGMDEETLQKIFDPFFTTKFTGRGLGMSAVLGIVRGHHGALEVASEVGKGSSFCLYLPVLNEDELQPQEPASLPAEAACAGSVLLVDDEEMVREVGCAMLEDMGLRVFQAKDGAQALDVYRQYEDDIDVVLLDMTMPKMDGKACFEALLQLNPQVKVLIASGYQASDIYARFGTQAPLGVVQKPFDFDTLKHAVAPYVTV